MEAVYSLVSQIFKGSFDFTQRLEKQCQNNTLLSTSQFVFTATEYWTEHLQNNLPLPQHFTIQFVLEGLSIMLKLNYFYINKLFFSSN